MFITTTDDFIKIEYRWQVDTYNPGGGWEKYEGGIKDKETAEKIRRKAHRATGCKTCKNYYAIRVYDTEKINRRIWALRQDNLHRSDIIDRSKDPAHIALVAENMKKAEKEILELSTLLKH